MGSKKEMVDGRWYRGGGRKDTKEEGIKGGRVGGRRKTEVGREEVERARACRGNHTKRQFKVRTDMAVVDRPEEPKRFTVVYNRRSRKHGVRRRVAVGVAEGEERPTRSNSYGNGEWLEREIWDMYGVKVKGHKDRRRLLSDYGEEGYPRRKDYPVSGYKERRYDEGRKRVVAEGRELGQEIR